MLKVIKGTRLKHGFIVIIATLFTFTTFLPACQGPGSYQESRDEPYLLAFSCDDKGCLPQEVPKQADGRIELQQRWSVDLTGDGRNEEIRLESERLKIRGCTVEPWDSNPDWKVLAAAPGDPNDDGRNDILIALLKEGPEGKLLSHPFIIGYRDGRFKTIWGGSAVPFAIFEVLLADVDSSGRQELVVLEAAKTGAGPAESLRTLSVWDWHGWGYNLRWRSDPGYYHNLNFIPSAEGSGLIIMQESTGAAE